MKFRRLVWLAVSGSLLALPLVARAQDSTVTGTVRDNTGGVLPGVTVTATNEAQGPNSLALPMSAECIAFRSSPPSTG